MPLSLRDLAAFAVPPADQTIGSDSLHRFAGGLREMAQLGQQREIEQQRLTQQADLQRQRIAADEAQRVASQQAAIAEETRKRSESRRVGAQRAFGDFSQLLHQPGGAARAQSQLPALQAHGVSWQALPDGGYGFVYAPDGGAAEKWGTLDLNKMSAEDKAATEAMLGAAARAQTGRTPTEVATAGQEAVSADPSLAGKDALTAFGGVTNPPLNRMQSAENSRRNAAALASARDTRNVGDSAGFEGDPMNLKRALDRQKELVRERLMAMRPLREAIANSTKAVEAMQSDNPLQQASAFFARLHANQGARPTDKDLQFELQSGGLLSRLESGITRAVNGEFGEQYRADFMEAARRVAAYDRQRLIQEARATGDLVRSDPGIPLLVGDAIHGKLSLQAEQWVLGGGMPDDGPPAPSDDADAELDELLGGP